MSQRNPLQYRYINVCGKEVTNKRHIATSLLTSCLVPIFRLHHLSFSLMSQTPPGSPPDSYNQFIKGFVAGALIGNLNKKLLLGALVGGVAGAYYQQQFGAPNVKEEFDKWKTIVLNAMQGKK